MWYGTLVCMACKSFVLCGYLRRDVGKPGLRSKTACNACLLNKLVLYVCGGWASCLGIILGNWCPILWAICPLVWSQHVLQGEGFWDNLNMKKTRGKQWLGR